MKTDILYKHRRPEVHELQNALRAAGLNIDYETASLIEAIVNRLRHESKDMTIGDAIVIQKDEEAKFEEYFRLLEENPEALKEGEW